MNTEELLRGLPGAELIDQGLADVRGGRRTVPALLVAIALPRLRRAGLVGEVAPELQLDSELQLYALLGLSGGDAYAEYNALLRRLVAFENALDHRLRRSAAGWGTTGADAESRPGKMGAGTGERAMGGHAAERGDGPDGCENV